ncbi:MAG: hypothetical protein V3W14_08220 [Candidatus Neomarinimicrobiota bacterium]
MIIILGGAIAWMILRLLRTMRQIMPGDKQKTPPPFKDDQIIDAEFEDLEEDK